MRFYSNLSPVVQSAIFSSKVPPRIEEVKIYFNQRGMPELEAEHFFLCYEKRAWNNRKGHPVTSWKNCAWGWIQTIINESPWLFEKNIH